MVKNRLENVKMTREESRNVLDFISEEANVEDIRGLIKWLGYRDKHVRDTVLKYFNGTELLDEALACNCDDAEDLD